MKKILWVFLLVMGVGSLYAADNSSTGRRAQMLLRYAPKTVTASNPVAAADFLKAVSQGNMEYILQITDKNLLFAQDKFENNIFHLAPNASTVQALAGLVRDLMGEDEFLLTLNSLRNQRNQFGETPLIRHINFGISDTFELLFKGSELASDIHTVRLVDKGEALNNTAWVFKGTAIAHSKDKSGRTVAQAALAHCQAGNAEMCKIKDNFQARAPYLF